MQSQNAKCLCTTYITHGICTRPKEGKVQCVLRRGRSGCPSSATPPRAVDRNARNGTPRQSTRVCDCGRLPDRFSESSSLPPLSLPHSCVCARAFSLSLSLAVRLDISLLSFLGFSIFATPQMSAENLPTYPRYLMHLLVQE